MSKKIKNIIDVQKALDLLSGGYSLEAKEFNFYQLRIRQEEVKNVFYDWFHTTGSLVRNKDGFCKSMGGIKNAEEVAIFISKDLKEIAK